MATVLKTGKKRIPLETKNKYLNTQTNTYTNTKKINKTKIKTCLLDSLIFLFNVPIVGKPPNSERLILRCGYGQRSIRKNGVDFSAMAFHFREAGLSVIHVPYLCTATKQKKVIRRKRKEKQADYSNGQRRRDRYGKEIHRKKRGRTSIKQ